MRRSHGWRVAAYGLSCLAVGVAVLMQGCPSQVAEVPEGRSTTPARESEDGLYRRVATQRPRPGPVAG